MKIFSKGLLLVLSLATLASCGGKGNDTITPTTSPNVDETETTPVEVPDGHSGLSEDDAIVIKTIANFNSMKVNPSLYYELGNDLDFNDEFINDFFSSTNPFKGHFDGKGHKISNFKIKAATTAGIFGNCDGASIKNLTLENAYIPFENGRATADIGVLCGKALRTNISNITIKGANIVVSCNSTSDINLGTIVGLSQSSSITNSKVVDSKINLTRSRLNVCCGIVAGRVEGASSSRMFIENVYADGKIQANCFYNNYKGSTFIGGFVGNLGSSGIIKNCGVISDIVITKEVSDIFPHEYDLAVGGFVGINNLGQMNITNCATISDINVYAGKIPTEDAYYNPDLTQEEMSKLPIYIGGFVGKAKANFIGIKNSNAIVKDKGINIYAKKENEVKKLVYSGEFVADITFKDRIVNCDGLNLELFDEVIKKMITDKALVI